MHEYSINCVAFLESVQSSCVPKSMKLVSHLVSGIHKKIIILFDPPHSSMKSEDKHDQDIFRYEQDMTNEATKKSIEGETAERVSVTSNPKHKSMIPKNEMSINEDDTSHTICHSDPDTRTDQLKDIPDNITVENRDNDSMLANECQISKLGFPKRARSCSDVDQIS